MVLVTCSSYPFVTNPNDKFAVLRCDQAHSHDHPGGVKFTDFSDGGPLEETIQFHISSAR